MKADRANVFLQPPLAEAPAEERKRARVFLDLKKMIKHAEDFAWDKVLQALKERRMKIACAKKEERRLKRERRAARVKKEDVSVRKAAAGPSFSGGGFLGRGPLPTDFRGPASRGLSEEEAGGRGPRSLSTFSCSGRSTSDDLRRAGPPPAIFLRPEEDKSPALVADAGRGPRRLAAFFS